MCFFDHFSLDYHLEYANLSSQGHLAVFTIMNNLFYRIDKASGPLFFFRLLRTVAEDLPGCGTSPAQTDFYRTVRL